METKTLDIKEFAKGIIEVAKKNLVNSKTGYLVPVFFILGGNGKMDVVATPWGSEEEKYFSLRAVTEWAQRVNATVVCSVADARVRGSKVDCIIMNVCTGDEKAFSISVKYTRDADGRFIFQEPTEAECVGDMIPRWTNTSTNAAIN